MNLTLKLNMMFERKNFCCLTRRSQRLSNANGKRVANEARAARTDRTVIVNPANSVVATWFVLTRVPAFHVYTCHCGGTFRVTQTFWSTGRRTSDVLRQTTANGLIVGRAALTIGSTWRRNTRVRWSHCYGCVFVNIAEDNKLIVYKSYMLVATRGRFWMEQDIQEKQIGLQAK